MPEEIRDTIREIEQAAEKLIDTARSEARGILEDANKKARELLSEELLVETFKKERDEIVSRANDEAQKKIGEARKASAGIRSSSSSAIEDFSASIAKQVKGIVA